MAIKKMIKYLFVNNYKTFVNFRVDFSEKSLLLGKNGTGKSSIMLIIAGLKAFVMGNGTSIGSLFAPSSTTRWMKSEIQTFELGIDEEENEFVYRLEVQQSIDGHFPSTVLLEKLVVNGETVLKVDEGRAFIRDNTENEGKEFLFDRTLSAVLPANYDNNNKRIQQFVNVISKIIFCMPNPKAMVDRVENDIYWPQIDFSNFASAYLGLTQMFPDVQERVNSSIREINNEFVRTKVFPEAFGKTFLFDYKYKDTDVTFRFSELSDGEKMIFVLYTLLYGYIGGGYMLLLDEPDNYLSLREIQPWCMALDRELDNYGQCILISHNTEMINYMADTDGIWMSRLASGESQVVDNPFKDIGKNNLLPYSDLIARGLDEE